MHEHKILWKVYYIISYKSLHPVLASNRHFNVKLVMKLNTCKCGKIITITKQRIHCNQFWQKTTARKEEKNIMWKTIAQKIMLSETDYAIRV